ncbi:MAG: diguanylate cyclase [Chloroflexi bacterium]|nr:diguanylate cyclase [Chloroflexota bacterium]
MNLQFRISSWLVVVGLIAGSLAVYNTVSLQRKNLVSEFEETSAIVAHTIHWSLNRAMLRNDREGIRQIIHDLKQDPTIEQIAIFGNTGDIWTSTEPAIPPTQPDKEIVRQVVESDQVHSWYGTRNGKSLICTTVPIPNASECQACHSAAEKVRGAVQVCFTADTLDQHISQQSQTIVVMGVSGFALLIATLLLVVTRVVVNPLRRMAKIVQAFGSGDYSMRMTAEENRNDELGTLARAFNNMVQRISQHTSDLNSRIGDLADELAKLNIFGQVTGSTSDFGKVLEGLGKTTKRLLHADVCNVYLMDEGGELRLIAGCAPNDLQAKASMADSIVGWVAREKRMAVVPDIAKDARCGPPAETTGANFTSLNFASIMAVPLLVDESVLGVIAVLSVTPRRFSEGDISLLSTIAKQAAVAVQNAKLYARVSERSITDGLTGLYNHQYFYERLEEELRRAAAENAPLSLIFCDIDHFKVFNDVNGHSLGDKALQAVARFIKLNSRAIDIPARYGGEEFTVILPETSDEGAFSIAERIRSEISRYPFEALNGGTFPITVSIGIASFPQDAHFARDLIDKADWAMYYAKRRGRNQTRVFRVEDAKEG